MTEESEHASRGEPGEGVARDYELTRPRLITPKPEAEEMLPIRREELRSYTERVERLTQAPLESDSNAAYFFLGLAGAFVTGAAGLGWGTDNPAAGVIEVFVAVAVMCVVVAFFCFRHDKRLKKVKGDEGGQLVKELRNLEARYPRDENS